MILTPPSTGGQQVLRHALAHRWAPTVAGTVAGLVVGIAIALGVPTSHPATVSMTVTSSSITPASVARVLLSNTTGMVTEQGVMKSAAVLSVAVVRFDNGITVEELRPNMEVSGNTNGMIAEIEHIAPTCQQTVDTTDTIANAYLTKRTAFVEQRVDEMAAGINEQTEALETELASPRPLTDEDDKTKGNPCAAEIRTELTKPVRDAEQLVPYHTTASHVITPAAVSNDEVSSSKSRLTFITTMAGLFAGLVLVLIHEVCSCPPTSPTQLADLTTLPVWSADEGAPEPWLAPTRMLAMAIDHNHWVDLIVDTPDPQTRDLHRILSASLIETHVSMPRLIDISQPLASLLDEVRPSRHVLVAVRRGHNLKALHALLDELAIISRKANGLIYPGDRMVAPTFAPTTPVQSVEAIGPKAEEGVVEETSSEKGKK